METSPTLHLYLRVARDEGIQVTIATAAITRSGIVVSIASDAIVLNATQDLDPGTQLIPLSAICTVSYDPMLLEYVRWRDKYLHDHDVTSGYRPSADDKPFAERAVKDGWLVKDADGHLHWGDKAKKNAKKTAARNISDRIFEL